MDPDRWRELDRLLDEALGLPADQRPTWLHGQPTALRGDLQRLLEQAEDLDRQNFLERAPTMAAEPSGGPGVDGRPVRVGPYELIRELGRGGMGTVWLARRADRQPDREIALKLPRFAIPDPQLAAVLERERDILASLNHAGIARLYDAGVTEQGQPWLALEYVQGEPLNVFCEQRRLGLGARLNLYLQIAGAVNYAHSHLVIHRDLKPSNVLVDEHGGAHLLDFGIAKILDQDGDRDSTVTRLWGSQAMTPDYASPEQLLGQPLSVATDVYSLGVLLYELLSGTKPYSLADVPAAKWAAVIENRTIPPPSSRCDDASEGKRLIGDLDTIVLKTLKRAPEERYPSVQALIDDIRRYQGGFPVAARPDSRRYVARKFLSRHRWAVSGAALLVASVAIGAALTTRQARLVEAQRQQTEAIQGYLADLIRSSNPVAQGPVNPSVAELLEQSLAELDDRPGLDQQTRFRIKALLVDGLTRIKGVEATSALAKAVAEQAEAALGPDHPVSVATRAVELSSHRLPGELLENRDALLALVEQARTTPGLDQEYLLSILLAQYRMHTQAWEFAEGVVVASEIAELAERLLGPRHPRAINARIVLANALLRNRENELALMTARGAFAQVKQIARDKELDPLGVESRLILGEALAANGEQAEALAILGDAVDSSLLLYPDQNSRAMVNVGTLARIQDRAGDLDAAVMNYRRVLARFSGPDKAAEAAIRSNLTRSLVAARRHQEAIAEATAWLAVTQDVPAGSLPYHTTADAARIALALSYVWAGDAGGARAVLDKIGPDYPVRRPGSMLDPAYAEGLLAQLQGDFGAAVAIHEESLKSMLSAPLPGRSHNEMHVRTALGLALAGAGRNEAAAAQLDQALALYPQYHEFLTPRWSDTLKERSKLSEALGRPDQAEQYRQRLQELGSNNRFANK